MTMTHFVIETHDGHKYHEDLEWPLEPQPPATGRCSTCVTPGYCDRSGTCAQGKELKAADET